MLMFDWEFIVRLVARVLPGSHVSDVIGRASNGLALYPRGCAC